MAGGSRCETGALSKADEERLKKGTKTGRGSNFVCVLTGAAIGGDYVKAEGWQDGWARASWRSLLKGKRSRDLSFASHRPRER